MLNRRDLLGMAPAALLAAASTAPRPARGADGPDYGRIDSHLHVHRDAPPVYEVLKQTHFRGIDIVVSPASGDEPFDLPAKVRETAAVSRASGGTLPWATTIDARGFDTPGFAERTVGALNKAFDDGAIAVKIWKNIGMAIRGKDGRYILPDDPALSPAYQAIQKAGKTLIAHIAEPDGAWLPLDAKNPELRYYSANPQWHMLNKPGAPDKATILAARDRLLASFPNLKVVGCHLGSDEDHLDLLGKRLDAYPNFAVDTAARIRYFARGDRDQARDFLTRYQDRILYGTDAVLRETTDPAAYAKSLRATHDLDWQFFSTDAELTYDGKPTRGLALPEAVLRKLFRENALRWFPALRG